MLEVPCPLKLIIAIPRGHTTKSYMLPAPTWTYAQLKKKWRINWDQENSDCGMP